MTLIVSAKYHLLSQSWDCCLLFRLDTDLLKYEVTIACFRTQWLNPDVPKKPINPETSKGWAVWAVKNQPHHWLIKAYWVFEGSKFYGLGRALGSTNSWFIIIIFFLSFFFSCKMIIIPLGLDCTVEQCPPLAGSIYRWSIPVYCVEADGMMLPHLCQVIHLSLNVSSIQHGNLAALSFLRLFPKHTCGLPVNVNGAV